MKTKVKTMQDLAATFPNIYREHKLLCHAQKKADKGEYTWIQVNSK